MIFRSRNYLLLWLSSSLSSLCVGNLLSVLSLASLSSRLFLLLNSLSFSFRLLNYSIIFFFTSFRTWPYLRCSFWLLNFWYINLLRRLSWFLFRLIDICTCRNYSIIFLFTSFRAWPNLLWFRNFIFSCLSSLCWLSLRLFKQLVFWSWHLFCLCTLLLSFSSSLWLILLLWILWVYSLINWKRISLSSRLLIISSCLCCYLLFFLLF